MNKLIALPVKAEDDFAEIERIFRKKREREMKMNEVKVSECRKRSREREAIMRHIKVRAAWTVIGAGSAAFGVFLAVKDIPSALFSAMVVLMAIGSAVRNDRV